MFITIQSKKARFLHNLFLRGAFEWFYDTWCCLLHRKGLYVYCHVESFLILIFGYLLGSVPFGFLIARQKGIDIRSVGSGNIGATNVGRIFGRSWGITTFLLDFSKGLLPVIAGTLIARHFLVGDSPTPSLSANLLPILAGIAAILGHNFPIFLRFRGGKGVATSAGVVTGLLGPLVLIGIVVWLGLVYLFSMVSLASMGAAVALAIASWIQWGMAESAGTPALPIALTGLAGLVIFRHKGNIQRILAGNERTVSWFQRKPKPNAPAPPPPTERDPS